MTTRRRRTLELASPLPCPRAAVLAAALAAGLLMLAWSARARAADYVVSGAGNDSAAGSAAAPWRTLQRIWSTVKAGDTVTVEDGTYAGFQCDGVSGTAGARIVVKARNRWGAKLTSASASSTQDFVQLNSCSYVTVDGFEVSGAPRSGIAILGNTNDGSDARGVTIQGCYSHDNGGATVAGRHDGVFSGFALDLTIQDNRIDTTGEHGIYVSNAADNPAILRNDVSNTGANGIQINADLSTGGDGLISGWRIEGNVVRSTKGAAGINLDGAINGVLRNNVVYNAAKGGITLFQGDGAAASYGNLIVNNTVYNPTGSRSAIQIADGANDNVVFNNIFFAQATGMEIQTVTGLMHDYNLVSSYSGGSAAAHESAPAPAAVFVSPSTGDLQLLATATAAVDKGAATFGGAAAPNADVLGASRPAGAGYDIGAYERGGTPAPGTGGSGAGTGGSTGAGGSGPGAGGSTGTGGRGTGGATGTGGRGTGGAASGTGGRGTGGAASGTGGRGTGGSRATGTGGAPAGTSSVGGGCSCDAAGAHGWAGAGLSTTLILALYAATTRRGRRRRARLSTRIR